ncbi:hemerythrin domain-containing protein [Proteiniclasticum sp.]|uniref:hemerythrin domain-containing protein n=1 Tax=Proteiniclasticum sp. TaxID=2053595 RepID=UPI0028978CE0|nr:hemerythrin domain-containing protein [Proteiniclasticum sp.]
MDVLTHIKEEHDEFRELMKKIESSKSAKKKELFRELYAKLHGHHEAEEKVVFPMVLEEVKAEDKEVVREMIEEHSLGQYQFKVLEKTDVEDETWDAKFMVLKEVLEHHMEEEEKEFITLAKKVIPKEKREELLEKFESVLEKKKKEKEKELK